MAELNWTAEAERWLRDIFDYIAQDDPAAAARTVAALVDRAQILLRHPEIGYRYDRIPGRHIRVLVFGHYRLAYLLRPDGGIDVLGVFHGALDMDRYLF